MNKHGCSWWLPISAASDFAFWQLSLVNTFPICLHVTDCHLTLSHLEESQASCCVIDRTGKELPGRRDTADVTSGMITDHPTPADNIRAPIILSDELLEERTEKLRLLLMGWIVTLSTQRSGTSISLFNINMISSGLGHRNWSAVRNTWSTRHSTGLVVPAGQCDGLNIMETLPSLVLTGERDVLYVNTPADHDHGHTGKRWLRTSSAEAVVCRLDRL